MFTAYAIYNNTSLIYRSPFPPISISDFRFTQTPEEGSLKINGYRYTFTKKGENTYLLITRKVTLDKVYRLFSLLTDYVSTIPLEKFEDIIFAIDDCLNKHCIIFEPNLELNNLMESYEEKIKDLENRNRELMMIKEQKLMNLGLSANASSYDLDRPKQETRKKELEVTGDDIQFFVNENVKAKMADNRVGDLSFEGEIQLYLRKKVDKVRFEHKGVLRFNPNLCKESLKRNILEGVRPFPICKAITLAKWTRNNVEIPFNVTYWEDEGSIEIEFFKDVYDLCVEFGDSLANLGDVGKGIQQLSSDSKPYPMVFKFRMEPSVKIVAEGVVKECCEYEVTVEE